MTWLTQLVIVHVLPLTWATSLLTPAHAGEFVAQTCNDLDFGNAQLEQFIRDRPDTADIIRRHSMLRWMLIWSFAGELKRGRVYWDNRQPEFAKAEHLPAIYRYPSLIRISKDQSAVDQCATLLFELFNSEIDSEYQLLVSIPADKRKSRDDFIASCISDEFKAAQKVQWFFIHYPIVGAHAKESDLYLQLVGINYDLATYIRFLKARDDDYLKYYGRAYDQAVSDNK